MSEIRVPELSESVTEATVGQWLKSEGDFVEQGEAVVELETDKVDLEVGAETAGVLVKVERDAGQTVSAGDVLGVIEEKEKDEDKDAESDARAGPSSETDGENEPEAPGEDEEAAAEREVPRATPVARRLAEEAGIQLSEVSGTGSDGRIVRADIERLRDRKEEPRGEEARRREPEPSEEPGDDAEEERPEERQRLSGRRRAIARNLAEAQARTATLTTFNDVDMSAVVDLRARFGDELEREQGARPGITSFFVAAAVAALRAFPKLNSELAGEELIVKRYYDIGIAVSDPKGLVVPVIRSCERLGLPEIQRAIDDLASRARTGELGIAELEGGTFTVTNGGIFGSLMSTPILNPPQVGILGLHRIEERPVGREGRIELRPMMYVALSYDHRVVDGAEAVSFLDRVKRLVEHPETFLLEPRAGSRPNRKEGSP